MVKYLPLLLIAQNMHTDKNLQQLPLEELADLSYGEWFKRGYNGEVLHISTIQDLGEKSLTKAALALRELTRRANEGIADMEQIRALRSAAREKFRGLRIIEKLSPDISI